MNKKMVQIKGPFKANEEVTNYIEDPDYRYIKEIGICTKTRHYVTLDNETFEIGKTAMLQFQDVRINSVRFAQNEDEKTLVDCILE